MNIEGLSEVLILPVKTDEDVVYFRKMVREYMVTLGFGLVDQTKIITAASELARNILRYGGGGEGLVGKTENDHQTGIELRFIDQGPGIEDLELAFTDGFTTGGGLGLGLSGAKRLSDEFHIETSAESGTAITIKKWKKF